MTCFIKIESNRLELEKIPFYVDKEVQSVVGLFAIAAAKKRIKMTHELYISHPRRLGDPLR